MGGVVIFRTIQQQHNPHSKHTLSVVATCPVDMRISVCRCFFIFNNIFEADGKIAADDT